jgi:hypothetical protein
LAPCRRATKTLVYEGGKSLDFLGFSRPNRAFSMGYAGFSLQEISRALLPPRPNRENVGRDFGHAEWTDCSSGKCSSISDFLQ